MVTCELTDPADTVKARLQMQGTLSGGALYSGTLDAFRSVRIHHSPKVSDSLQAHP